MSSCRPIGWLCGSWCALVLLSTCVAAADFPAFEAREIDPHAGEICYAVAIADVDTDQKPDIVVVTENRVVWYQNPTWQQRVILADQTVPHNVCIAAHDIDGDGHVDFAIGAGWTGPNTGTIQWASRGTSLDEPWHVHMIGEERWLHRMSFADVLNTGKPQLVISPLNATVGDGVRLTAFEIPADPKTGRWQPTVMDDTLNRMHNHWHVDLTGAGIAGTATLTASQEGVHFIMRDGAGQWRKRKLSDGMPGSRPSDQGAGEITSGRFNDSVRFFATIEPMHGTSVVFYTPPAARDEPWKRLVLDDTLRRGHAISAADLDGDGTMELIAGHSEPAAGEVNGPGIYLYKATEAQGTQWARHVLDAGGVAVEDLEVADLNGDGRPDVVAVGRDTHNVKVYFNTGVSAR